MPRPTDANAELAPEADSQETADYDDLPTQELPRPPEILPAGSVVAGRYRVVRRLGQGGFGVVFHAVDLTLERPIALKRLNQACDPSSLQAQRFAQEARTLASLDHPHIVPIYDAGFDGDHPYITMKLIDSHSLSRRIRKRPLSETESLLVLGRVCKGLAHAHSRGVLHRDVKPSNILVTTGGGVFLVDFGLATTAFRPEAQRGRVAGTLPYMAPETFAGEVTERSDLYSLGAVLYEMLFRHPCFTGTDSSSLRDKIVDEEPPLLSEPPDDVRPPCLALLRRLLAKDPADRPPNAQTLLAEVAQLLKSRPKPRRKTGPQAKGSPLARLEGRVRELDEICEKAGVSTDKVLKPVSVFLPEAAQLVDRLKIAAASPRAAEARAPALSLLHLSLQVERRIEALRPDDGADFPLAGAAQQLESRVLVPVKHLLRQLEEATAAGGPPEDFFTFDDEAPREKAPLDLEWIDNLCSRKELERHEAVVTLVSSGLESFLGELAARPAEARDELLGALWEKADVLLLEGRGSSKPVFEAALEHASDPELVKKWRLLYSLFQKIGSDYWDPEMVHHSLDQSTGDDRRVLGRSLLLHPWATYRRIALELLEPPDFWLVIAHETTPIPLILELWRHLRPRVAQDYLKIFFVCVNERLRQGGDAERILAVVELTKELYTVESFHENLFFEMLSGLDEAVREEARRHHLLIDFDAAYMKQMRTFLAGPARRDQPVGGWTRVPLPVQRHLARRGYFLKHFSCHPVDPIALECLTHLRECEDISTYLKLFTLNGRLVVELSKEKRLFQLERNKYALVSNPKTPAFVIAKHIGFLRGDFLRALVNSRDCSPFARESAKRLIAKRSRFRASSGPPGGT